MPTTAEIKKLTEHTFNIKGLLNRTAKVAENAGPIIEEYAENLGQFESHLRDVSRNSADLKALMADMGNASEAMREAFRDDKKPDQPKVEAKPEDTAHLNETK